MPSSTTRTNGIRPVLFAAVASVFVLATLIGQWGVMNRQKRQVAPPNVRLELQIKELAKTVENMQNDQTRTQNQVAALQMETTELREKYLRVEKQWSQLQLNAEFPQSRLQQNVSAAWMLSTKAMHNDAPRTSTESGKNNTTIPACRGDGTALAPGSWCLLDGQPHACFPVLGHLLKVENQPPPTPLCQVGALSHGSCSSGQFLCSAAALDVSVVIVTSPRPVGMLNQTLSSLIDALSSLLARLPPLGSAGPSISVVSVRSEHPEMEAVQKWWEEEQAQHASAVPLFFHTLSVPAVASLSSSLLTHDLSPLVRHALRSATAATAAAAAAAHNNSRNNNNNTGGGGGGGAKRAGVFQQVADIAAAVEWEVGRRGEGQVLLLEDDFHACPSLPSLLLQGSLALTARGGPVAVWLSEGGNGFLLPASAWASLAAFLLHNVGLVPALRTAAGGCASTEAGLGPSGSCLQPLPVDWLIQDWIMGGKRCACCCAEDYALPPPPSHSRGSLGQVMGGSRAFVHVGRASTLRHAHASLASLDSRLKLDDFVRDQCRTPDPAALRLVATV